MGEIKSSITKASYMLHRLRDSGYKADKLIGISDSNSLKADRKKLLEKLFPEKKPFFVGDIIDIIDKHQGVILKTLYTTPNYSDHDSRVWTILIDGGKSNILLTFYKNSKGVDDQYEEFGDDFFEISDGGQFVRPLRKRLNTHSFEVIVQELNNLGLTNKHG